MSDLGPTEPPVEHSTPHMADSGLCGCSCEDCTLRLIGACICPDCVCDSDGDDVPTHGAYVWPVVDPKATFTTIADTGWVRFEAIVNPQVPTKSDIKEGQ